MKRIIAVFGILACATPALALDPLGDKSGWGGFLNIGVAGGEGESNFFARMSGLDIDLSDDTIDDLGPPGGKDFVMPALAGEFGYTFSNKKTRIFVGNDFADFLQFDRSTRFAIRHDFDRIGTLQLAYLSAPMIATEVWSDPYLTGTARDSTDLEVSGARLTWDRIFGTALELKISSTERDIDEERSGVSQPLTAEEQRLLDRNGDVFRVELGYLAKIGSSHFLRPSVTYIDRDLDGRAMAQEGVNLDLSYIYNPGRASWRWVTTASYGEHDGDEENPLFGEKHDSERIFFASTLFFPGDFGIKNWTFNIGVIYGDDDSDIDFNDINVWMLSAGVLRRW